MKIFLSWSGERSKRVARALGDWISQVVQAVEPWFSPDIEKGVRWSHEMASQLDSSVVGIICLTRDNLESKWIHFEAGALAKGQNGRVWTFLLDILPPDVKPPLSDFQATSFDRDEVLRLLTSINTRLDVVGEKPLDDERLKKLFEKFWPELESALQAIAQEKPLARVPERKQGDVLDEILVTVRRLSSVLESGERPLGSLADALEGRPSRSSEKSRRNLAGDDLFSPGKMPRLAIARCRERILNDLASRSDPLTLAPADLANLIAEELQLHPKTVKYCLDTMGDEPLSARRAQ